MASPNILIVEDGTIVTDANSYITYEYADSYHALRGNSAWTDGAILDKQYAIVRATQGVDSLYKTKWKGSQSEYGTQELEWPRQQVYVNDELLDDDIIPTSLKKAIADAALKEFITPSVLTPDLDRGGEIKRVKADTVEVEYMEGADSTTTFSSIDGLIADLVDGGSNSSIESYDITLAG